MVICSVSYLHGLLDYHSQLPHSKWLKMDGRKHLTIFNMCVCVCTHMFGFKPMTFRWEVQVSPMDPTQHHYNYLILIVTVSGMSWNGCVVKVTSIQPLMKNTSVQLMPFKTQKKTLICLSIRSEKLCSRLAQYFVIKVTYIL